MEQVYNLIKPACELPFEHRLISLNDKGYIPEMENYLSCKKLKHEDKKALIDEIRAKDRKAQGITEKEEAAAECAIKNKIINKNLTIVHLPHSKCATITDRLYGTYENLLIISDDELNFYGSKKICQILLKKFGGWSGNNFWGCCNPKNKEKIIKKIKKLDRKG